MGNYKKISVDMGAARAELHNELALTGTEISINNMPAGAQVPFVHQHRNNEEVYVVLAGRGVMNIDGEDVELTAGDWLRVDAPAKRQLRAAADSPISVVCIQAKAGSLEAFTADDAVVL